MAGKVYNFERWLEGSDFGGFRGVVPVGTKAPDFTGTDLSTGVVRCLSEFWQAQDLVIEFGSLT